MSRLDLSRRAVIRGLGLSLPMLMLHAGSRPAAAQAATTIRVAYVPTIGQLPLFVAQHKGFFAKQGLNVLLTPGTNVATFAPGLGGQYDVVVGTPTDFLTAVAQGINVVTFAAASMDDRQHNSVALLVAPGSDITSVKDLEGKSVATPGLGGAVMMSVQYQIKRAGADPAAVRFVQMPFAAMVDQLKAGRIHAALAANPFIGIMEKAGAKSLGNPFLVLSDETVTLLWQTTPAFAAANREALAKWRAAYREALDYIEKNEDEARTLLSQELKVTAEVAKSAILSRGAVEVRARDLDVWLTVLQGLDIVKPGAVPPFRDLIVSD